MEDSQLNFFHLNPQAHEQENPIYFDYLGWFMISYSVTVAIVINVLVSIICLVGIILSIWSHIRTFSEFLEYIVKNKKHTVT